MPFGEHGIDGEFDQQLLPENLERFELLDFWAYSTGRFERCQALMGSAEFPGHVRALRAG